MESPKAGRQNDLLICSVCQQFGRKIGKDGKHNHFFTGSKGFRTSKLDAHVINNEHQDALCAKYASENPGKSPIEKGIITLNETEIAHLSKLFKTAFYLAQREMPFTEFEELLSLQSVNFDIDLLRIYANDKQAKVFIEYIAKDISTELMSDVKKGPFAVLCDGGTDSSVMEEEIMYVRYIEQTSFKPVTKY